MIYSQYTHTYTYIKSHAHVCMYLPCMYMHINMVSDTAYTGGDDMASMQPNVHTQFLPQLHHMQVFMMYMYVYVHAYAHFLPPFNVCIFIHTHIYSQFFLNYTTYNNLYIYIHIYIHIYIGRYTWIYICIYICTYTRNIYIYIYIYIYGADKDASILFCPCMVCCVCIYSLYVCKNMNARTHERPYVCIYKCVSLCM